jgi:drug/metabolite transporter (DMT)-like permease
MNKHEVRTSPGPVLYVKLVLTAVFWGGTFVAARVVSREASPFSAAFLRFVVASIFLLILMTKTNGGMVLFERKPFIPLLTLGLTGVFAYNFFFFLGLKTVTASRASLIIAANPAFIALFSCIIFREKLGFLRASGIVISVFGAIVVVLRGDPTAIFEGKLGLGELCIFGCVASWVAYSLIGKVAMKNSSPLQAVTSACVIGMACLFFPALGEGLVENAVHLSADVWLGIVYLGFFGSALGFIWYYEGILSIGPARTGVFINIVPVSGVLLAYIFLHEVPDASLIAGAFLIVCGVYLTNRPDSGIHSEAASQTITK